MLVFIITSIYIPVIIHICRYKSIFKLWVLRYSGNSDIQISIFYQFYQFAYPVIPNNTCLSVRVNIR